jgi:hypothetical protein
MIFILLLILFTVYLIIYSVNTSFNMFLHIFTLIDKIYKTVLSSPSDQYFKTSYVRQACNGTN